MSQRRALGLLFLVLGLVSALTELTTTFSRVSGIQVARRTVAKYREALKIAPANLRKAL